MPTTPTLPVAQETFHTMVRLHVYGRTDEAIAKELNLELQVVRAVRWDFHEEWDAAVEALIPTFTREMVFQTVAAIHLLASMTTDTKELATLAYAEERHLKLIQGKKPRTKKPRPQPVVPTAPQQEQATPFTANDVAKALEQQAEKLAATPVLPVAEPPPPTPPPDAPRPTFRQCMRTAAVVVLLVANIFFWGHAVRNTLTARDLPSAPVATRPLAHPPNR